MSSTLVGVKISHFRKRPLIVHTSFGRTIRNENGPDPKKPVASVGLPLTLKAHDLCLKPSQKKATF
ncbi:hypothetical protein PanWU01x14_016190 [Parasponia andersonii]|uniref:Uncharacterized protein n=1 Tax=Parasponia andersonii TaxID=3476 RepID=A0A2P5E0R9_PARAD|nr:hypothetical protein PanWU01x14_016190 [Parasponia andersonii]